MNYDSLVRFSPFFNISALLLLAPLAVGCSEATPPSPPVRAPARVSPPVQYSGGLVTLAAPWLSSGIAWVPVVRSGEEVLSVDRIGDTVLTVRLPLGGTGDRITLTVDWQGEVSEEGPIDLVGFQSAEAHSLVLSDDRFAWPHSLPTSIVGHAGTRLGRLDVSSGRVSLYPDSVYLARSRRGPGISYRDNVVVDLRLADPLSGQPDTARAWDLLGVPQLENQQLAPLGAVNVWHVIEMGPYSWFLGGKHLSTLVTSSDSGASWQTRIEWMEEPHNYYFSRQKDLLALRVWRSGGVPVFDTRTGAVAYFIADLTGVTGASFAADGLSLYVVGTAPTFESVLLELDAATGQVIHKIPFDSGAFGTPMAIWADSYSEDVYVAARVRDDSTATDRLHLLIFDRTDWTLQGNLPVTVSNSCNGARCRSGIIISDPTSIYVVPASNSMTYRFDRLAN